MDEVSARAEMADAGVESPLVVSVSHTGIEQALEQDGADLILDVVRQNGQREMRRVSLALDKEALERLSAQGTDPIRIALDPESLAVTFDDVEAHGLREAGAALAVLVVTAGGGAGMAQAYPADGSTPAGGHAEAAQTAEAFVPWVTDFPSVQAEVVEAGMPRAMPSDYAAAAAATDIEQIRASQPAPDEGPLPSGHIVSTPADTSSDAIENVRVGAPAVPDPSSTIENVRATRTAPEVGDSGGITIDAPNAGVTAALAGGAALTIAAAAFALRRRREPEPAT
jgi:hypothetical protein